MISSNEMQSILNRLNVLEKQNSRLKKVFVSFGLVVFVGAIVGFVAPRRVQNKVTANSFEVVDSRGRVRARLSVSDVGPYLGFWDEQNRFRINLNIERGEPQLVFGEGEGPSPSRMLLKAYKKGSELHLIDNKHRLQWRSIDHSKEYDVNKKVDPPIDKKISSLVGKIKKKYPSESEEDIVAFIHVAQKQLKEKKVNIELLKLSELIVNTIPTNQTAKRPKVKLTEVVLTLVLLIIGDEFYAKNLDQASTDARDFLEVLITSGEKKK